MPFFSKFLLLFFLISCSTVFALTPPLPEKELVKEADLIIHGKVTSIEKDGKTEKDHCYRWQTFKSNVEIKKIFKGKSESKIIIIKYKTQMENLNNCVGGDDSFYLELDKIYKMYLKRDIPSHYHFFHWCGLQDPQTGNPFCTK